MDKLLSSAEQAPRALIRTGLVTMDLAAVPLLASASAGLVAFFAGAIATAAGGASLVLDLFPLDVFPVFPDGARILTGLSLVAFAALLFASTLLLWRLSWAVWHRFWDWHRSSWQGHWVRLANVTKASGQAKGAPALLRAVRLSGLVFLGLFTAAFAVMMLLARGEFWHAWGWFV